MGSTKSTERIPNIWGGKYLTGQDLEKHRRFQFGKKEGENGFGEQEKEIDRRTMEGFGIPQQDYKLYKGKTIFSRKRENWQCMIFGKTRPKYEWAQIIGHVAATHGRKSRGK